MSEIQSGSISVLAVSLSAERAVASIERLDTFPAASYLCTTLG
jgi:hypothetical protein